MKRNFTQNAATLRRWPRSVALEMALEQRALGRRIAELRESRGNPAQHVVAAAVGVTLRAYQAWEHGESRPKWDNLQRLAEYYGIEIDEIIGDNGTTPIAHTPNRQLLLEILERLGRLEEELTMLGSALFPLEEADEDVARFFERRRRNASLDDDEEPGDPRAAEG